MRIRIRIRGSSSIEIRIRIRAEIRIGMCMGTDIGIDTIHLWVLVGNHGTHTCLQPRPQS